MNKYLSFFRLRFVNSLQYRSAAFAGIATQFFWGLMELLLFSAFYRAGDTAALPMRFDQLASYIWLQQAFLALFMNWYWDEDILSAITEGSIAYELCRPLDLYTMWFARSAASRLAKAVLRCMPILVIAALLPPPFRLGLPASLPDFLLFLLSMLLGFSVVVTFAMLIYALCFFTISPMGVRIVAMSLMELLSGSVLPLPFLPDKLRAVLELLPFASMQNVPLRIYAGQIAGGERAFTMALQAVWLVLLAAAGKALMNRALRRVVVQDG